MPLPLHIFEPRYRAMVRDAVRGPRLIGMVLLRGDWEKDYAGAPEIFGIGTVGELARMRRAAGWPLRHRAARAARVRDPSRADPLAVPRGGGELARAPARCPRVRTCEPGIGDVVLRYLQRTGRAGEQASLVESGVDDETFVNFLAQHLDLDPLEKQALLEAPDLAGRGRRLLDVLEFRLEELRLDPGGHGVRRAH